jgi:hypothetical protein
MSEPSTPPEPAPSEGYELDRPEEKAAKPPATTARPAPQPTPTSASARPAEAPAPLVRGGRYDLPLLGAGVAVGVFVIACLAGLTSLFPQWSFAGVETDVWIRANVAVRGVLLIAIATACLLAGLVILVFLDGRPTGDVRVVAVRCAMIAAIAVLARAVPFPWEFLKATWDFAGPLAVAFLLLIAMFRLKARDATVALGASLIVLVLLSVASMLVSFATGGPAGPAEQTQRSTVS